MDRKFGIVLAVVALGYAAACQIEAGPSTGQSPPQPPGSTDAGNQTAACGVFAPAELNRVMGTTMDRGSEVKGPLGAAGCQYFATGSGKAVFALFLFHAPKIDDAKRMLEQSYTPRDTQVPGVGDEAQALITADQARIAFRKGTLAATITISGATPQPDLATLKTLAQETLDRA